MDIAKLSRISLSLLATLQVLLQERNARAAAKKLNLSQSAISKNLAQLRLMFDDPLFHRVSNGLAPTPQARSLEGPLCDALFQIDTLLNPQEFVPGKYNGRLRLAMHDAGYAFIGAPLLALCHRQAPGLEMDLWYKDTRGIQALANGEIDLLILPHDVGHQWHSYENLVWREIYREPLSCLVRSGNPVLDRELSTVRGGAGAPPFPWNPPPGCEAGE
ncbi:MAG: LysR family transcriptional regulator, partial [Proteobacteria bacterium]|nr:LysR family transcriptional regulator [Pseudomonadota bacterium]